MKRKKRIPWIPEQDAYLKLHYANMQTQDIANAVGHTLRATYDRAQKFRLKKSEEFISSVNSGRFSPGGKYNISTQFKKGDKPWNYGKKITEYMRPETIEKFEKNRYQSGHLPHNTKHDGAITTRKMAGTNTYYKWIRVAQGKWEMLHRKIWMEANGPIPDDMVLFFKDRNTLNVTIENLELITKRENMLRNTIHRYPEELKTTIKLASKLKRKIKDHYGNKEHR